MALPKELVIGGSVLADEKGDTGAGKTSPLVTNDMFKRKVDVEVANQVVATNLLKEYRIAELPGGDFSGLLKVDENALPLWYKALWAMCTAYDQRVTDKSDKYRPGGLPYIYNNAIVFYVDLSEHMLFSDGTIDKKAEYDERNSQQQYGR
jgi:hypothetical protein